MLHHFSILFLEINQSQQAAQSSTLYCRWMKIEINNKLLGEHLLYTSMAWYAEFGDNNKTARLTTLSWTST